MEVQEIEVVIDKDGQVQLHVRGVKGQACLELTAGLENALGSQVILREMTPESLENSRGESLDNPLNVRGK